MLLVFDSGTTNTKAFLFDENLRMISSASHPTRILCGGGGMAEQSPDFWWDAAVIAAGKVRSVYRWKREDISAVAASSQGATFVPLDGSGNPLRCGITWLDNRAASISAHLQTRFGSEYFFKKTGRFFEGWSPPAVCLWLKENEPEVFRKMKRVSFVSDYLNFKLSGGFFLDQTSAQMTCFYNILEGRWDADIVDIAGIEKNSLPEVIPSDSTGGGVSAAAAALLNIAEGTPVIAGGHDQYCAAIGADAGNRGDCLLSCGTAWALLAAVEKPVFLAGSGWFPGRHLIPGGFGLMAPISNGGILLDWVKRNVIVDEARCSGKSKVEVAPDFAVGKGAVKNISLADTGNDIYNAALRSLASIVNSRLEALGSAVEIRRFVLAGGGAGEKRLPEILEKTTGKEIFPSGITEAAGYGAALLAGGKARCAPRR